MGASRSRTVSEKFGLPPGKNTERAYIAASRRSDRSLQARLESAFKASAIHKSLTGRALRITEEIVLRDDAYEEEDDGPLRSHRFPRSPAVPIRQEKAKSTNRVTDAAGRQSVALLLLEMDEQWRNGVINRLFAESFPNAVDAQAEHFRQDLNSQWAPAPASDCEGSPYVSEGGAGTELSSPPTDPRSEQCAQNYSWPVRSAANDGVVTAAGVPSKLPTVWTDAPASASYAASLLRLTGANFAPPESQDIAADSWSSSSPGGPFAWANEYGLEEHREQEASDHIRAAIDAHAWMDYVDFDAPQNSLDGPGMMTSTGTC